MAKYYKFDSGLTLLYEKNNINKSTSIEILFDCGSRCDGELDGLSHFCEHMMFTGTKELSKQEATKRYFDFMSVNAYTNTHGIGFWGVIMTSDLSNYLNVVQDMICNTVVTKESVEYEKKIIIQEIIKYTDNHKENAYHCKMKELFNLDYYTSGSLGTKETVNKITSKDVKNYIKKYLVKNNCTISICSALSFSKIKDIIKNNFDSKMPKNNLKPLPYCREKLIEDEKVDVYNKDIDKNFLSIVFKLKRKGADIRYRTILGAICNMIDDISDGLTKYLRINNSLIYSMNCDYMLNFENSYVDIYTEIGKENIKPCIDIILNYISGLMQNGFTLEELEKEKKKGVYYEYMKVETPNNIRFVLTGYRFYGKFVTNKDVNNIVQKLTLEELNDVMKQIFKDAKIQVFVYGNATKKDVYTIAQIKKKFIKG